MVSNVMYRRHQTGAGVQMEVHTFTTTSGLLEIWQDCREHNRVMVAENGDQVGCSPVTSERASEGGVTDEQQRPAGMYLNSWPYKSCFPGGASAKKTVANAGEM